MGGTRQSVRDGVEGHVGDDEIRVLLVDDDETWADSTAQVLEHQRESFSVRTATGVDAALSAFSDDEPDCVVSDYQLERRTGLDLLADVRERAPDRPFVLITGQGDETVASEAIGKQVTDYIPKRSLGGRDDLLARRIESTVQSYRTEQALARERRSKEAMLDIVRASSSREGIAREFCEHLVRERDYDCAWIGTTANGSREVVPRAAAGATDYVDAAVEPGTVPGESSEPALVALDRREPHAVAGIDARDTDGWRDVADGLGFESAVAAPIVHDDTVFGVVAVYDDTADRGFREEELLREYGETIGYALRSAEWKESLLSTAPVAIEVELDARAVPLVAVDEHLPAGSRIDVLTTVVNEETLLYVLEVTGAAPADLEDLGIDAVERVTVTSEDDQLRCEVAVTRPTPESRLAARGGRVVEATVERGRATVTAVTADEDDVRSLIDAVRAAYPDAGVRSVRSGERNRPSGDVALTDRQREALELAYFNGFFERPREHNATEVAEKLGVSRQTFTQHLRAGERKVLDDYLGSGSDDSAARPGTDV